MILPGTKDSKINFNLYGSYALFTDPISYSGGEKSTYHIPTYDALRGICESIYWKPTFIWVVDKLKVINPIKTQSLGMTPLKYNDSNYDLCIYTYLRNVFYQVEAHIEWNPDRPDLEEDRNMGKHHAIALRSLDRGGRKNIHLGVSECPGYVTPCEFGDIEGVYDNLPECAFGKIFHGYTYPGINNDILYARFWDVVMKNGIIEFVPPEQCTMVRPIRRKIA